MHTYCYMWNLMEHEECFLNKYIYVTNNKIFTTNIIIPLNINTICIWSSLNPRSPASFSLVSVYQLRQYIPLSPLYFAHQKVAMVALNWEYHVFGRRKMLIAYWGMIEITNWMRISLPSLFKWRWHQPWISWRIRAWKNVNDSFFNCPQFLAQTRFKSLGDLLSLKNRLDLSILTAWQTLVVVDLSKKSAWSAKNNWWRVEHVRQSFTPFSTFTSTSQTIILDNTFDTNLNKYDDRGSLWWRPRDGRNDVDLFSPI